MNSIIFLSVMNGAGWGGSEEQWYRLALWLARKGTKVGIVVFDWPQKENHLLTLKDAGCTIYLLPRRKGNSLVHTLRLKRLLKNIPFRSYNAAFINQGGWKDVVHGPFKKLYKQLPPYILSFHNYQVQAKLPVAKKSRLQQWVNHARINVADAAKIFEVLEEEMLTNVPNQKVMANPITFELPQSATLYPANDTILFVVLAALDMERKAQDILVKALSSLKWKQRNWVVHLYGEGRDRDVLQQLIVKHDLQSKILLKGYSQNVSGILQKAHLLIQCTHIDAMPISVVEAMAMARPCIVSAVGDMPRWINGTNGFVCQQVTEKLVDETLELAWQERDQWEIMGKNAYATFLQKYPQPYEQQLAALLDLS